MHHFVQVRPAGLFLFITITFLLNRFSIFAKNFGFIGIKKRDFLTENTLIQNSTTAFLTFIVICHCIPLFLSIFFQMPATLAFRQNAFSYFT